MFSCDICLVELDASASVRVHAADALPSLKELLLLAEAIEAGMDTTRAITAAWSVHAHLVRADLQQEAQGLREVLDFAVDTLRSTQQPPLPKLRLHDLSDEDSQPHTAPPAQDGSSSQINSSEATHPHSHVCLLTHLCTLPCLHCSQHFQESSIALSTMLHTRRLWR